MITGDPVLDAWLYAHGHYLAAAVLWTAAAVMLGYGPAYCLTVALRQRRDRRQLASTPQPRAHVEWSRLQSAVAQARADIAAEAGVVDEAEDVLFQQMCFERWEAEL